MDNQVLNLSKNPNRSASPVTTPKTHAGTQKATNGIHQNQARSSPNIQAMTVNNNGLSANALAQAALSLVNANNNNNNNNGNKSQPQQQPMMPSLNGNQISNGTRSNQTKYQQLLSVIDEMGKDLRTTYMSNKNSTEKLKRGIASARLLVKDCLLECERNSFK